METHRGTHEGPHNLIITHRLATDIHTIGRIVVLEHGTIAEQGTGTELLAKNGVYAKLYKAGQYEQE